MKSWRKWFRNNYGFWRVSFRAFGFRFFSAPSIKGRVIGWERIAK